MLRPSRFRRLLPALLALAILGCDRKPAPVPVQVPEESRSTPRIVSLSPAITQIIIDLGEERSLVGVGDDDMAASSSLPKVGRLDDVRTEKLQSLHPTAVLTMAGAQGPPAKLTAMAGKGMKVVAYPPPYNLTDLGTILGTLVDPEQTDTARPGIAQVLGVSETAVTVWGRVLAQLVGVSNAVRGAERPRVLLVTFASPASYTVEGPGTLLHEALTQYCGGVNAAEWTYGGGDNPKPIVRETARAPSYDKEKILNHMPDVVIILDPRGRPLDPIDRDDRLALLRGMPIPAVKNNHLVLIDDPLALLPSTSIGRVAVLLAKGIHPDRAERIDEELKKFKEAATRPVEPMAPLEHDEPATRPAMNRSVTPASRPTPAPAQNPATQP